jgi:hypothetical protein
MSRQSEDRNRQKFADKMRQKTLAARNAKLTVKKAPATTAPSADGDSAKKD